MYKVNREGLEPCSEALVAQGVVSKYLEGRKDMVEEVMSVRSWHVARLRLKSYPNIEGQHLFRKHSKIRGTHHVVFFSRLKSFKSCIIAQGTTARGNRTPDESLVTRSRIQLRYTEEDR